MNHDTGAEPGGDKEKGDADTSNQWTTATKLQAAALVASTIAAIATVFVVGLNYTGQRATNRAWLTFDSMSMSKFAADEPVVFDVSIRNSGKTPAFDIVTASALQPTNADPLPEPVYELGVIKARPIVGPGQTRSFQVITKSPIPQNLYHQIMTGSLGFYVYVMLTYHDPYYGERGVETCGQFRYERNTPTTLYDCSHHNRVW